MDDTTTALRTEAVLDLMRDVFHGVAERQDEAMLHTELSMAQVKALVVIGKGGELSVGHIAKELHVGLSAASQIVDRLVKSGLARRQAHPNDRRVIQCSLTETGQATLAQFQTGGRILRRWLEQMDPDALRKLEEGLAGLVAVVHENQQ